jgi:hypothetical protein
MIASRLVPLEEVDDPTHRGVGVGQRQRRPRPEACQDSAKQRSSLVSDMRPILPAHDSSSPAGSTTRCGMLLTSNRS